MFALIVIFYYIFLVYKKCTLYHFAGTVSLCVKFFQQRNVLENAGTNK